MLEHSSSHTHLSKLDGLTTLRFIAALYVLPLVALTIYGFASLTQDRAAVFDRFMQNRLFAYLGDISYSFFLLQIPVMVWLDHNKQTVQHISQMELFIYTLGITLLLAMFSYHFVKRKGREMILAFAYKPGWQTR